MSQAFGSRQTTKVKQQHEVEGLGEAMSESNEAPTTNANSSTPAAKTSSDDKVKVHFVAVGAAPIMKKTKFLISADQRFSSVIAFLRKMLKMANNGSSLFLYCNSAFVPGPDELVGDLRDCFNVRGELVINYALQVRPALLFVCLLDNTFFHDGRTLTSYHFLHLFAGSVGLAL